MMPASGLYGEACVDKHSVVITDRGGGVVFAELRDLSQVRWSRLRDDVSDAYVVIRGAACSAQANILSRIEPKRHEMVVYRGTERVWEGPVMRVGWHADWVEIAAHDVMEYVFGTALTRAWDNSYHGDGVTEVTTRCRNILEWELQEWESLTPPANVLPYLQIYNFANEARTSTSTTPFQMTVGEHIDNLARTQGIDYTCVGRAIHIWDTSRWIGQTQVMTEADIFGEVIITAYGADLATRAYTVASDGSYGTATVNDAYYGPWSKVFTTYDEEDSAAPTQAELNSQAKRNLSGRTPVPIEVRIPDNSSVRLSNKFNPSTLVPGVRIPLLATLNARQTSQMQKVHQLVVTETPDGENVALTLMPATREDDAEEAAATSLLQVQRGQT